MIERFIARQPIFDSQLKVFAYELLFRSGPDNIFRPKESCADEVIVNSTMLLDMQQLVGRALAFINLDAPALLREAPRLLSPGKVVLEILETVDPTPDVVAACRALAADQYVLALDDFLDEPKWQPLIPAVRFLKVDFRAADRELRRSIARRYIPKGIHLLAEKVETEAELLEARDCGYTFFQGYFFCKPSLHRRRDIPSGSTASLRLLQQCAAPELNYDAIEELFSGEPALTFRLLRFLNSPVLPLRAEIHNVRHAISLLGQREFRRWVAVVALVMAAGDKPAELVRTALTRAFFSEELARPLGLAASSSDLFLLGLLSAADGLLDRPLPQILSELSLAPEIREALDGGGSPFDDVYQTLLAYEHGDWAKLSQLAQSRGYAEDQIPGCFVAANKRAAAILA